MSSFADRSRPSTPRRAEGARTGPPALHVPRPPWSPAAFDGWPGRASAPDPAVPARPPNRTGLPDALKAGVEALSGLSMDDVRVHRNSPRPAALQAHAFVQGGEIHLGPGQERHLAHEIWHVVQQKEGRVPATTQLAGTRMNDDRALETEASVMGDAALRIGKTAQALGPGGWATGALSRPTTAQLARWVPGDRPRSQEAVVQAFTYRRTAGTEEEVVKVEIEGGRVKLSGHVRVEGNLVEATGSVPLQADEVTENQVNAQGDRATRIAAMRLRNISASPSRMRLGNLLTLYHAQTAQQRGVDYIVARDIVPSAEDFYTRLGFNWFLDPGPRPQLQTERREIQERMRLIGLVEEQRGTPLPHDFDGLSAMDIAGRDLLAKDAQIGRAGMFVRTDALIQASLDALAGWWTAQ